MVTIDKQLGIKTRGAREIRDYIRVERKLVEFEGIDKKFVLENQFSASVFKDSALKFNIKRCRYAERVISRWCIRKQSRI